jgi:hypothetical protein
VSRIEAGGGVNEANGEQNGEIAYGTLKSFLESDGWHPQEIEGHLLKMGFSGANSQVACFAQIRVDKQQFLFYVMSPVNVPEDRRARAAEFLTRANWGLRIGNFEMDYSDGQVRYKSSVDFEGFPLEGPMIRNAIYPAVQTMDRYLPGLMTMIYGDAEPADAILKAEGQ